MNLTDLRTLLDYHYWARDRVLAALDPVSPEDWLREQGGSFKSLRETAGHTYAAETFWHLRWNGHSPTALLPPETFASPSVLRTLWTESETKIRGFVEELGEEGIKRVFAYRLMSGEEASSIFWHMLQHVVNHASYHRGQVTMLLRQMGYPGPKSMDLITFYRTR